MSALIFDSLTIPVPSHLINRLKVFSDGILGIEGVRVQPKSTKLFFRVFNWTDVEKLHSLNVRFDNELDTLSKKIESKSNQLLFRRIKYSCKSN